MFTIILVCACHGTFLGQTPSPEKQNCVSDLQVTISPDIIMAGETYTFTATHSKTNLNLKYEWITSNGEIIEGQGTPILRVKLKEDEGKGLVATVQLIGLPENCSQAVASASGSPYCPPDSVLIDSFKKSTPDIEERLGIIATRLEEAPPHSHLVIAIKFDGKTTRTQGEAYIKRLFNYFTKNLSVKPAQLLFVASDEGDNTTDVYIVPEGATLPDFPKEHELFKGEDLVRKFSAKKQSK